MPARRTTLSAEIAHGSGTPSCSRKLGSLLLLDLLVSAGGSGLLAFLTHSFRRVDHNQTRIRGLLLAWLGNDFGLLSYLISLETLCGYGEGVDRAIIGIFFAVCGLAFAFWIFCGAVMAHEGEILDVGDLGL